MDKQKLYAVVRLPEGEVIVVDTDTERAMFPTEALVLLYNEDISRLLSEHPQGYIEEVME